jgi:hypothetical protein
LNDPIWLFVINYPISAAIVALVGCWFLLRRATFLITRFKVWNRLRFARKLKEALEELRAANGNFPYSPTFRPLQGASREDIARWLPELSSDALEKLPRWVDNNSNGIGQWLYRSDGHDFKLIFHQPLPLEGQFVFRHYTNYVDPERTSEMTARAFGLWTPGAISW